MKGLFASIFAAIFLGSCSQDTPLEIWPDNNSTTVFFGTVELGGEEYTGPGFVLGKMNVKWTGSLPLKLLSYTIKIPASGKLSADGLCSIDSDLLQELFPGLTDLTLQPNQTYQGINIVCSGLSAKSKRDQFFVTGRGSIRGVMGEAGGQKFFKGEHKMVLYWFPEEDLN